MAMSPRSYALLAAVVFAVAAVLQLIRAVLGWPVTVDTTWSTLSIPLWPNWIACIVFALLAWLGLRASRT
jgi:hypothetical protein